MGGEADRLGAGSLYGIVHGIYSENKQTNTVSGSGPSQKTRVIISALPQGFPQRKIISYVVHIMTLILTYWLCPDLTMVSISRGQSSQPQCILSFG